ncbi:MFS general substrate transporter [Stereum hirsutum FP-91666 SS1]|uniref:MFS general substrate transporter n=1 Tax=Stereum hirsutum (strain FP-91666) TaxID=721885 RepID=UPI0004410445|nr:MFS general substrate transporter [Stereum hirsutum FP-91666 SS1]EIM87901.1 MFS general substrate transporter [Stereum hirsutum FP-91666 SS1]
MAPSIVLPELSYPPATASSAPGALVSEELLPESTSTRRLRMGAAFVTLFLAGWNGGATGALIPYIEEAYNIGYARVAILFVSTFLGYAAAAAASGTLARKIGFGRALLVAVAIELVGNAINSSQQVNFNLMCFGFWVVGVAFATQLGLCHAYFALLRRPLMYTGILHGIYGLGAFASPLVATAMVTHGIPYHLFYVTNVGMNVPVFALVWFAFHDLQALPAHPAEPQVSVGGTDHSLRETLTSKTVWILAIFLMLYVGAEETIGGWIVSYVLEVRKGSPEGASWVASAFYLGLAIGRIALPALNTFIGERRAIFFYLAIAIALEAIAWAVPAVASTAAATALVGLAISTFYATVITTGGKLLPRRLHADAFAIISSVGQIGSALFPLLVGLLSAQKGVGIWIVEPSVVALLGAQGACWWFVPRVDRIPRVE